MGRNTAVSHDDILSEVSRYLEIGGEYQFNRIRFSNRNQELNAHIGRVRIQSAVNSQFSVILLTQYNSEANIVGSNVRVRYNFREGVDFYLVYNQVLNTDRQRYGFELPTTNNSAVLLKYVHTFSR